jgi:hypothetical protein
MTCERKHVADSTKASQTPEHLRKFRTFDELINHNQPSEVSSNARAALAMEITSLGFTAWSIFSSTKDIIMAASHSSSPWIDPQKATNPVRNQGF